MNIFDRLRAGFSGSVVERDAPTSTHEPLVSRPVVHAPVFLKKGMWVLTPDGVGIVVSFYETGEVDVHLTDNDGLTIATVVMPAGRITGQARYEDIPAPRRPTREVAAALGYN